jgi:hypothetical protein
VRPNSTGALTGSIVVATVDQLGAFRRNDDGQGKEDREGETEHLARGGAVHVGKPLPAGLVKKMVRARVAENKARQKT